MRPERIRRELQYPTARAARGGARAAIVVVQQGREVRRVAREVGVGEQLERAHRRLADGGLAVAQPAHDGGGVRAERRRAG